MNVHFLLGPAGTGKTKRCLDGVREALASDPDGAPLLFIAPKQATFQIERQVMADGRVEGFSRLEILSFERLARHVLERAGDRMPGLLGEEGRVMVLRALLAQNEGELGHFGKLSKAVGLAREVSVVLRTFQEHGLGSGHLEELAERSVLPGGLRGKLADWSRLLRAYQRWLREAGLVDPSELPWRAVELLRASPEPCWFESVWMDGFAEMTPAEIALLAAVGSRAGRVTAAFCLDTGAVKAGHPALWNVVQRTFQSCHAALASEPEAVVAVEDLDRDLERGRFRTNPALARLEMRMGRNMEQAGPGSGVGGDPRIYLCQDPHGEAELAAREIRRHVRDGGRYREVAVLARSLEEYGAVFQRVFRQHGIPCFLDHRHGLRHHPLVELTRTAMRIAADGQMEEDWFAWLKCGLLPLGEWEGERLENVLRAERWAGRRWTRGSELPDGHALGPLMKRVVAPLRELAASLAGGVEGPGLATAIRRLWKTLAVAETLEGWDDAGVDGVRHLTVLKEVEEWLEEASRAFAGHGLTAAEWLPVVESAWSGLTAGAVPPSLDQVLIGAIDRSRNPDLELVLLPGWTEGGFPAAQGVSGILTVSDREALERAGIGLGPTPVDRVHHEHFYAYIALTRSAKAMIITLPREGITGGTRVPSPLLRRWLSGCVPEPDPEPGTMAMSDRTVWEPAPVGSERLSEAWVKRLWEDRTLATSASGLEQMAGCRFAHFAQRILNAGEREERVADARELGNWTHELLAGFHRALRLEGRTWHGLDPADGEDRVRAVAKGLREDPRLWTGGPGVWFELGRAEESVVAWIRHWLAVLPLWPGEPEWVEEPFGSVHGWGSLDIGLTDDARVRIVGKVDRVDVLPLAGGEDGLAWVVDYKGGLRRLDPRRVAAGFELQLPLYLRAVCQGTGLRPAGMTYASLKPQRERSTTRDEPGGEPAYVHRGRIDVEAVNTVAGGVDWSLLPFAVRLKKDGSPYANSDGALSGELERLMESALGRVRELGEGLLAGDVSARPVADAGQLPCEYCAYRDVCRIGGESGDEADGPERRVSLGG